MGTGSIIISIIVILALGFSVVYPAYWIFHYRAMDLPSYYIAGKLVLSGNNPYHPVELGMTAQALGLDNPIYPYIYFPMIALIFMPLSLLDYHTVQTIWFFVSQLFFWLSLFLMHFLINRQKTTNSKDSYRSSMIIILISCFSYPLIVNFQNGQVNTIILFLLSAFLVLLMKKSDYLAGISLGIVCMIKPQPLIIIPYLLFKRRFLAAGATALSFIIGTVATVQVVGWNNFLYYLKEVMPTFALVKTSFPSIPIYVPANQSIHGLIYRLLDTTQYSAGFVHYPSLVKPVANLVVFFILSVTAYKIWKWNKNQSESDNSIFRDSVFLLLTSIIISPITWDHHIVIASLAAVYQILGKPRFSLKHPANILVVFFWILLMLPLYPDNSFWMQNPFTTIGMSLKTFALLGFWGSFAFQSVENMTDLRN